MSKKPRRDKRKARQIKKSKPASSRQSQLAHTLISQAIELREQGRTAQATELLNRALTIDPLQPAALQHLALLKSENGNVDGAVELLQRSLKVESRDPVCHNNLGNLLRQQGRTEEATLAYKAAIALDPNYVNALFNVGIAFSETAPKRALGYLEHSARLAPSDTLIWETLGKVRAKTRDSEGAESAFRRAIKLEPRNADAYSGLAGVFLGRGELEKAREHWNKALAVDPQHSFSIEGLARAGKYCLDDRAELDRLELMLVDASDDEDACVLHFALGKMYDDCELHDEAFRHYEAGNQLRWCANPVEPATIAEEVSRIESIFTESFFAEHQGFGISSETPVFVVGLPRSGTTLVEQIVASHPNAAGIGEAPFMTQLVRDLSAETSTGYPMSVASVQRARSVSLAEAYLAELEQACPGALRITDKALSGAMYLGLVALLFPNARVVYCRRDLLNSGLSMYFQRFTPGTLAFSYDLRSIGIYCKQFVELMRYWGQTLPLSVHEVVYEDLVAHQERESRALIEHLGLPWDDGCLSFFRNDRSVHTASHWQVRRPIYSDSVNRAEPYRSFLGPLVNEIADEH